MAMVQYGIWGNCCNDCKFCTRKLRIPYSKKKMLSNIEYIKSNLDFIDWKGQFQHGISIIGGEIYHIQDKEIQDAYLSMIDAIIDKVIKKSPHPYCKYSSVTNGLYEPTFLFKVLDKIKNEAGLEHIDINFSYDLKYRYKDKEQEKKVLELINEVHKRYNYKVGIQMILTQYLIDYIDKGKFSIKDFLENQVPGNTLTFLYPHEINSGFKLDDFYFKRKDFLRFICWLWNEHRDVCSQTISSVYHSESFKYSGFVNKSTTDLTQQPILWDGKEDKTKCGHSKIYRIYSDSNECLACDLLNMDLVYKVDF